MKSIIDFAQCGEKYREFFSFEEDENEGKETFDETNHELKYVTCKNIFESSIDICSYEYLWVFNIENKTCTMPCKG